MLPKARAGMWKIPSSTTAAMHEKFVTAPWLSCAGDWKATLRAPSAPAAGVPSSTGAGGAGPTLISPDSALHMDTGVLPASGSLLRAWQRSLYHRARRGPRNGTTTWKTSLEIPAISTTEPPIESLLSPPSARQLQFTKSTFASTPTVILRLRASAEMSRNVGAIGAAIVGNTGEVAGEAPLLVPEAPRAFVKLHLNVYSTERSNPRTTISLELLRPARFASSPPMRYASHTIGPRGTASPVITFIMWSTT